MQPALATEQYRGDKTTPALVLSRVANVYGKLFAEGSESGLHLVEPGGVPEIQQAIHLGHVTIQPAGEFRFAHVGGSHCGIKSQLGFRQSGERHEGPFAAGGAGHRDVSPEVDVTHKGRLNGIRSAQERLFSILAERVSFRDVGNVHQDSAIGVVGELDAIAQHRF